MEINEVKIENPLLINITGNKYLTVSINYFILRNFKLIKMGNTQNINI